MGGGGGGSSSYNRPNELEKLLKQATFETRDSQYATSVANLFSLSLANFNARPVDKIKELISDIKTAIEEELDGTVDLLFGGSVAKHTYIDGFSDIDSLVILDNCDLANNSPEAAKEYFAGQLQNKFQGAKIEVGTLAVTISLDGLEIQLLPAISCENHLKIADSTGKEWAEIRPKEFTTRLTKVNQDLSGRVIPTIKLAKAIIANLPKKQQISGYHAESIAIEAFSGYQKEVTHKAMLRHYFEQAAELVKHPIKDRTGQSIHVDEPLGNSNSLERKIISSAFDRIVRRINNADNATSVEEWRKLFGK